MINFSSLPTLVKTDVSGSHYLLVEDKSSSFDSKISIETLFANLVTLGTSSEQLYASITNKNQLNFKGIKSATASLLTVTTVDNNIVLTPLPAGIDLNVCNNANSGFLKSIDFSETIDGVNAVVNGGTGLAAIAKGAMLYANATDTIAATAAMSTNGQLLIGNATSGIPTLATLTAGTGITITNSPGAITLNATIANAAANINLDDGSGTTYNIDTNNGEGWLSGNGTDEGITVDDTGKVFIGQATPTAVFDETLNIKGGIRFTNDSAPTIKPSETISSNAGQSLTIEGGSSAAGNAGNLLLKAGTASGSADGGNILLYGGDEGGAGITGSIKNYVYNGSRGVVQALTITGGSATPNVTVNAGNLEITAATKGIVHTGSGTVSQDENKSQAVTIHSTSGIITLDSAALAAAAETEFTVTNSTVQSNSMILLTVQSPLASTAANGASLHSELSSVNLGNFTIRLTNPGSEATSGVYKIHFLVINLS
jgi:hypothetical protein